MHKRKSTLAVLSMIAISLASGGAHALVQPGLSIGPQIGSSKSEDTDGKWLIGAAVRARLLGAIGAEGSIGYRHDEFSNEMGKIKTWPVQVTGLLYPLPIVYGGIGAGWYHTTLDFDDPGVDSDTTQKFGWHFGGGVDAPLGDRTNLTLDLRYVFLDYKFETVPGVGDVKNDFYMVTAGLQLGF